MKRKFPRRRVIVNGPNDIWGADLVEMQEWANKNKGFRYMLNVIDCFTKYAWSIPLKDKKGVTVLDAFKKIVKDSKMIPKHLWVDEGKEFYNKDMTQWLKDNDIVRYSTHGEHKSAIVERFNRTLKTKMWTRFTAENTRNWIDMLGKLMKDYNSTVHHTTKYKPIDAAANESDVWNNIETSRIVERTVPKFKVGDSVRISRIKGIFEKGYLPNYSEELFKIVEVKRTDPVTYILKDLQTEIVAGGFYEQELQKATQDVFRIEKVLRKKTINAIPHGLVKWLGYSNKFNEYLPLSEIKQIQETH